MYSRSKTSPEEKLQHINDINEILSSLAANDEFHSSLQLNEVNKALSNWTGVERISAEEEANLTKIPAVSSVLENLQKFQRACQKAGISAQTPNLQMINGIKKRMPHLPDAFLKIYLGSAFEDYKLSIQKQQNQNKDLINVKLSEPALRDKTSVNIVVSNSQMTASTESKPDTADTADLKSSYDANIMTEGGAAQIITSTNAYEPPIMSAQSTTWIQSNHVHIRICENTETPSASIEADISPPIDASDSQLISDNLKPMHTSFVGNLPADLPSRAASPIPSPTLPNTVYDIGLTLHHTSMVSLEPTAMPLAAETIGIAAETSDMAAETSDMAAETIGIAAETSDMVAETSDIAEYLSPSTTSATPKPITTHYTIPISVTGMPKSIAASASSSVPPSTASTMSIATQPAIDRDRVIKACAYTTAVSTTEQVDDVHVPVAVTAPVSESYRDESKFVVTNAICDYEDQSVSLTSSGTQDIKSSPNAAAVSTSVDDVITSLIDEGEENGRENHAGVEKDVEMERKSQNGECDSVNVEVQVSLDSVCPCVEYDETNENQIAVGEQSEALGEEVDGVHGPEVDNTEGKYEDDLDAHSTDVNEDEEQVDTNTNPQNLDDSSQTRETDGDVTNLNHPRNADHSSELLLAEGDYKEISGGENAIISHEPPVIISDSNQELYVPKDQTIDEVVTDVVSADLLTVISPIVGIQQVHADYKQIDLAASVSNFDADDNCVVVGDVNWETAQLRQYIEEERAKQMIRVSDLSDHTFGSNRSQVNTNPKNDNVSPDPNESVCVASVRKSGMKNEEAHLIFTSEREELMRMVMTLQQRVLQLECDLRDERRLRDLENHAAEAARADEFRRFIQEYEREKVAAAAAAIHEEAEMRLTDCFHMSISSPGLTYNGSVISTMIQDSLSQSAIGAHPLSSAAPSYWTVKIHALMGDDIIIGITGSTVIRPLQLHKFESTVAWGSSGDYVYINGVELACFDDWNCRWEANDVAVFRYDPVPPRTLSLHHSRSDRIFTISNLPPDEYRIYFDFFNCTSVVGLGRASVAQKFLFT